ncbi:hypothetical protein BaRGS_00010754 [Batillaria attramentaria]|uniref:Uncharacterized protein n=1 Tax=Batillaria attramentaria TaxID=370345 RepID=A0ABD0LFI5_9CAEN
MCCLYCYQLVCGNTLSVVCLGVHTVKTTPNQFGIRASACYNNNVSPRPFVSITEQPSVQARRKTRTVSDCKPPAAVASVSINSTLSNITLTRQQGYYKHHNSCDVLLKFNTYTDTTF